MKFRIAGAAIIAPLDNRADSSILKINLRDDSTHHGGVYLLSEFRLAPVIVAGLRCQTLCSSR